MFMVFVHFRTLHEEIEEDDRDLPEYCHENANRKLATRRRRKGKPVSFQ